eukprot:11203302-Lingulodinium_polyedra.AAC.1
MPPPGVQLPLREPDGRLAVGAEDAYNFFNVKLTAIMWCLGIVTLLSVGATNTLFPIKASPRWRRGLGF